MSGIDIYIYAAAIAVIAISLAALFEWRDRRRRRVLDRVNRRLAIDAQFVELSQDLALTYDFDNNVISCNQAWTDKLGLTLEDLQNEPFGARLHPDDLDGVKKGIAKIAQGKASRDIPLRFRHKDGTWRWLEWNSVASPEDRLVFSSARDVTERVLLQDSLDIERRQLRSAQEIARIGSWHLDLATGEMFWSDATYELLGIEPPEGPPDAELWLSSLDPAEHDRALARLADAIKNGGEFSFDFQRAQLDKHGEAVYITTKGYAESDAKGRTIRLIGTLVDVTERKRYQEGLQFIADHDPLTSLPNRRKFDEVFTRHLAECERYGPRGALLMIDLDKLKTVNDECGHIAGDRMLMFLADALRERIRETDIAARIGGDEFAILLRDTTHQGAWLVARALSQRLAAASPELRKAGIDRVTASIGIALVESVKAIAPAELIGAADDAMYAAKRAGPGNIREHSSVADTRLNSAA